MTAAAVGVILPRGLKLNPDWVVGSTRSFFEVSRVSFSWGVAGVMGLLWPVKS